MLFIKGMENVFHFERPKSFISIELLETEIKYYSQELLVCMDKIMICDYILS